MFFSQQIKGFLKPQRGEELLAYSFFDVRALTERNRLRGGHDFSVDTIFQRSPEVVHSNFYGDRRMQSHQRFLGVGLRVEIEALAGLTTLCERAQRMMRQQTIVEVFIMDKQMLVAPLSYAGLLETTLALPAAIPFRIRVFSLGMSEPWTPAFYRLSVVMSGYLVRPRQ